MTAATERTVPTDLATTHWDERSSSPAWFKVTYVRDYAKRIGAELEEW